MGGGKQPWCSFPHDNGLATFMAAEGDRSSMGISSNRFELQPRTEKEVEEWVCVLVRALRRASRGWQLAIVQDEQGIFFECSPALTNEQVGAAYRVDEQ